MASSPTSVPPLTRLFIDLWLAALFGAAVLAIGDCGVVLARGSVGGLTAVRYLAATLAMATWTSLFLAMVATLGFALARATERLWRGWPELAAAVTAGAAIGLAIGWFSVQILRPADLPSDPYHFALLLPALGVVAGILATLARRYLPLWLALVLVSVGTCLVFAVDAMVLRRLYLTFHNLAAFVVLQLAMVGAWWLRDLWALRRPRVAALAVVVTAHLLLLFGFQDLRELASAHGVIHPKLERALRHSIDFDRDGHSPVFGGGDCDDWDSSVYPGRCEVLGNNIDDNCNGLTDPEPPAPAGGRPPWAWSMSPDIYLILVDGWRGDNAGMDLGELPAIAALAARGLRFERTYTSYPSTFRAMLSMVQSRHWRHAGAGHVTLPNLLADAGYDVQMWIRADRRIHGAGDRQIIQSDRSVGDDFRLYTTAGKEHWTRAMFDEAVAELSDAAAAPRFRWLHLLDAHQPFHHGGSGADKIDRYRAALGFMDEQVGRLVSALASTERGRQAVIIVLGDHGDEFGEHGGEYHGATLYDEVARVGMVMLLPGREPRVVTTPASQIDLVPTLFGHLGYAGQASWQGLDWLGEAPAQRLVFAQVEAVDNWGGIGRPAIHMVSDGRHKLIINLDDNIVQLFDLANDPGERRNLAHREEAVRSRLGRALALWQDLPGCHPGR